MMKSKLLKFVFLLAIPINISAADWYVDDNSNTNDSYTIASAAGNDGAAGTSANPFASLTHAIAVASAGDRIFIDAGTYDEDGIVVTTPNLTITGAGYTLSVFDHNFAGTSTDFFMYINASNITLQSIQVTGYENNGTQMPGHSAQAITIGGNATDRTGILIEDVVVNGNGQSGGNPGISVLDNSGVTLRGGGSFCNTDGTAFTGGVEAFGTNINLTIEDYIMGNNYKDNGFDGGGLRIEGDATTIVSVTNSRISNNVATDGGGISIHSGMLTVTDCIIDGNSAGETASTIYGGGVRMYGGTATFTRTVFSNNVLGTAGGTLKGGAIGVFPTENDVFLTIDNCLFFGNAASSGPDIYARPNAAHEYTITCTQTTFSNLANALVENDNSMNTCTGSDFTIADCGNPSTLSTNGGGGASCNINKTNTNAPASIANPTPPDFSGPCGSIILCATVPPTGTANQSFCLVDAPTIADIVVVGTAVLWYDSPLGGTLLNSTDALTDGTTYYASQTAGTPPCESTSRLAVTVTVSNPLVPTGSAVQTFCAIDAPTVSDLSATGTAIQWYDAASGGNLLLNTDLLVTGTSYFASQTVGGCESNRLQVDVTISDPAAPTGTQAQSFCAIDLPTVADLVATGTALQWYDAASGGNLLLSTDLLVTGTSYFASQTVSACESDTRFQADVTINDPDAPSGTQAQSFCAIDLPTVADLAATGTALQWYDAPTGGNLLLSTDALTDATAYFASQTLGACESDTRFQADVTINDPAAPSGTQAQSFCAIDLPTVADLVATGTALQWYDAASGGNLLLSTDLLVTGTSYFASQTVSACESDTRFQADVTINDPDAPSGTQAQSFCAIDLPTVADLAATGTALQWYDAPTGGNLLLSTDALTDATSYFASQTLGACESDTRFQADVTINDPDAPSGTLAQDFCSIDLPTVADLVATGTALQWYDAASGGNLLNAGDALTDASSYFATQTIAGCESDTRFQVDVAINDPAAPTGTLAQDFCSIDLPTVADLVATGTAIQWYDAANGGNLLNSTTLLIDATSYFASQTIGGCESDTRLQVNVTVNDPAAPTCPAEQAFCSIDQATVADLSVTGTNIQWYDASSGGNPVNLTDLLIDGNSYFASQTVGACESDILIGVDVTLNDPISPSGATVQSFCSLDTPTVADLVATGTTIQWYDAATGGNLLNSTDALANGTYFASQTVSGCESDTRLQVAVTVNDPTAPTANAAQTFCQIDNPTIADLVATGSGILWYDAATGGNLLNSSTALVNGTSYFATQTVGGCESDTRRQVTVTISNPAAPNGNPNQVFCSEDNPTVADLSTTNGTTILWYTTLTGGTALNPNTPLVNGGTYFASQIINGCESIGRLEILVSIQTVNLAFVNLQTPTCGQSDGMINLIASGGSLPYTFNWSNGMSGAMITGISPGDYHAIVTDQNGCQDSMSFVLYCVNPDIPQIITPGKNGKNETWILGMSSIYPQMTVSIYNRWGNEVYYASPYNDDWDGMANRGVTVGNEYLPSGTYFYIIDLKNGDKPLSGYLELVK